MYFQRWEDNRRQSNSLLTVLLAVFFLGSSVVITLPSFDSLVVFRLFSAAANPHLTIVFNPKGFGATKKARAREYPQRGGDGKAKHQNMLRVFY